MNTLIHFIKMERSEAVESYVRDQLSTLQHHIPHNKEAHFHVWLESINGHSEKKKKEFRCAIEIDGLVKKQFFAEKRSSNFYTAFNHCIDALDKVFRQEKKIVNSRKRQGRGGFENMAS